MKSIPTTTGLIKTLFNPEQVLIWVNGTLLKANMRDLFT